MISRVLNNIKGISFCFKEDKEIKREIDALNEKIEVIVINVYNRPTEQERFGGKQKCSIKDLYLSKVHVHDNSINYEFTSKGDFFIENGNKIRAILCLRGKTRDLDDVHKIKKYKNKIMDLNNKKSFIFKNIDKIKKVAFLFCFGLLEISLLFFGLSSTNMLIKISYVFAYVFSSAHLIKCYNSKFIKTGKLVLI